jgi:cAMP-specific phosphodiesterase 4
MFQQGDQERALGQRVSPLMDRTKGGVTKSQCGFFNVVALPLFQVRLPLTD